LYFQLYLYLFHLNQYLQFNFRVPGVPANGYNIFAAPGGQPGIIGCGPTTGAIILDCHDNTLASGLIVNPLADARLTGYFTYINVLVTSKLDLTIDNLSS
jgi:hypothetical protein